jgi:hypothetical protein
MSGDAGARAPAQDEPRDLIRASIRARAVAAPTVWRVPACNSSIAARRSSRRPGVASRSASASAETQSSSGIECTTGLSVALGFRGEPRRSRARAGSALGSAMMPVAYRGCRATGLEQDRVPTQWGQSAPKVAFRPHWDPILAANWGLTHHRQFVQLSETGNGMIVQGVRAGGRCAATASPSAMPPGRVRGRTWRARPRSLYG